MTLTVGFVIRANKSLLLDESFDDLSIELREIVREALAENLKPAMPLPKIPNPVLAIGNGLAFYFSCDITFRPPQEPNPNSVRSKNISKLDPLPFSDPEPAVDDEPRRCQSLRRPLYLGNDFLRDRSRSLLIAREVHRVLGAALGRRTHVGRVTKHFS
jgi:hypothetical protein